MKILTISLLSICLIVILGTVGEAIREDDLALYLSFDEGKGIIARDKSKHQNDGIIHKAQRAKGKIGNAIELTGETGGWVEVPDSSSLDITDEITLMCWVYPNEFTAEWFRILVKIWAGDTAPWMVYGLYEQGGSNGKTGFIVSVDNGTERRCGNRPSPQLPLRRWTHLAATYDGSKMKLYYDGEVKVEQDAIGKIDTNNIPVSIGRNSEGEREHYIGLIDEVAIWSVALDESEIREAMDQVFVDEPAATVSFTRPTIVSAGEAFTAMVNIVNAVDLAGAQLSLHFDPTVLEVTDIHEGDLLSGAGAFFQVEHLKSVPGEISGIRLARTGVWMEMAHS